MTASDLQKNKRIPEDLEPCMTFVESHSFSYDLRLTGHLYTINGNRILEKRSIEICTPGWRKYIA